VFNEDMKTSNRHGFVKGDPKPKGNSLKNSGLILRLSNRENSHSGEKKIGTGFDTEDREKKKGQKS